MGVVLDYVLLVLGRPHGRLNGDNLTQGSQPRASSFSPDIGFQVPNRMARDSARSSRTLAQLSDFGERGFWRLMLYADDFGRFEADPEIVRVECFKRMLDKVSVAHAEQMLRECVAVGLIFLYEVEGKTYGEFVNADKYFTRRAKHSKYPSATQTPRTCDADATHMRPRGEGRGANNEGRGGTTTNPDGFVPSKGDIQNLVQNLAHQKRNPGQSWRS